MTNSLTPNTQHLTPVVLALLMFCLLGPRAFGETSNRIVAIVGEEVITEADVASRLDVLLEGPQGASRDAAQPEGMRLAVLNRLIDQRLMLQEARRMELTVGAEEVTDGLEVLRRRFGSEEALRHSLVEAGLSKEQLKQQLREQLLVKKVIAVAVRSKITVSPHDVAQELKVHPEASESNELVEVSHILVRVSGSRPEEQAKERINEVHQALVGGAGFAEVAKQYSEDPNAPQGGAMGWVGPGILMPELDTTVFSLTEGTFSSPLQTRLGFHIVRVGRRRTVSSMSALEAKRTIERQIFQRKFQEAFTRWITDLKRRAYIEIRHES